MLLKYTYLVLYNLIQWSGWCVIFFYTVYFRRSSPQLQLLVNAFQLLAILEVVHAITGLVRSSPITTFVQVFGRLQVLWVMHHVGNDILWSRGVFPMLFAWSTIEIVRYLFFALGLAGVHPFTLKWLRYTLFYVLYPLGVYGEMRVLWDSLGQVDGLFAVRLPNSWNFAFSLGMYIRFLLVVLYIPLFVNQYMHMIRLRRGVSDVDRSK